MKKLILLSTFILIGLFSSSNLYAQVNLDIANSISCSFTIHVAWNDGSNCQLDSNIAVGSGPSYWTLGNPLGAGTSPFITIVCNNCGDIAIIGDCNFANACPCSSLTCCYTHTCSCGSPVNYRYIPFVAPFSNTRLEIY
ncbi:MAG: hypothetical protein IT243_06685 [Bacteroidia bacterium]|nr:hypothetical protein [Bacteroidia bacterium]